MVTLSTTILFTLLLSLNVVFDMVLHHYSLFIALANLYTNEVSPGKLVLYASILLQFAFSIIIDWRIRKVKKENKSKSKGEES